MDNGRRHMLRQYFRTCRALVAITKGIQLALDMNALQERNYASEVPALGNG
jgi:hypothetical protein